MLKFETTTCARCAGTGRLAQYSRVDGGVCYGCNGSKLVYTKAGAAARKAHKAALDAALNAALGIKASEIKIGDVVERVSLDLAVCEVKTNRFGKIEAAVKSDRNGTPHWTVVDFDPDTIVRLYDAETVVRVARETEDAILATGMAGVARKN